MPLLFQSLASQLCNCHKSFTHGLAPPRYRDVEIQGLIHMSAPNPLHLANTAQSMARSAEGGDAKAFQKVALVSMCVMAAATAATLVRDVLKDLNRKQTGKQFGDDCGRGR
jgi:hypothetical protein